ncbi:MAG: hypothetical protein Q9163_004923 [Psora crenata]
MNTVVGSWSSPTKTIGVAAYANIMIPLIRGQCLYGAHQPVDAANLIPLDLIQIGPQEFMCWCIWKPAARCRRRTVALSINNMLSLAELEVITQESSRLSAHWFNNRYEINKWNSGNLEAENFGVLADTDPSQRPGKFYSLASTDAFVTGLTTGLVFTVAMIPM